MRLGNFLKMSYLPMAALILSGSSAFAASPHSASNTPVVQFETAQPSAEASRLLEEIQPLARQLDRDAATLASYTNNRLSWQSHASQLTLAKQHINAIGERIGELQAIRRTSAPWQQRAIDSIVPVAVELASRTEAAIGHLNENRGHLFSPVYTDHLRTIGEQADRLQQTVDTHLELASTEEKLNDLRERMVGSES